MDATMRVSALAAAGWLVASCATALATPVAGDGAMHDAELASRLGANEQGLRAYVFVLLKSGPNKLPPGPERAEMFKGHFANIQRLSDEGKLVYAGPLDGVDGRRGIFIFAVPDIEEVKKLVATDPVIEKGEMVAEYHKHFGSAALMQVPQTHKRLVKKSQ